MFSEAMNALDLTGENTIENYLNYTFSYAITNAPGNYLLWGILSAWDEKMPNERNRVKSVFKISP